jgi:hypothetical protein
LERFDLLLQSKTNIYYVFTRIALETISKLQLKTELSQLEGNCPAERIIWTRYGQDSVTRGLSEGNFRSESDDSNGI